MFSTTFDMMMEQLTKIESWRGWITIFFRRVETSFGRKSQRNQAGSKVSQPLEFLPAQRMLTDMFRVESFLQERIILTKYCSSHNLTLDYNIVEAWII